MLRRAAAQQDRSGVQKAAHSRLNEKLGSEDMKEWLRSRMIQAGVMDMSVSVEDELLREESLMQGVL